ncbi:hypothetical protein A9K69_19580 [Stenotrophomonas maltophilia]|nr:hypothetical protein A9K69_19580 [Stenotrophomonas maltophilia]
MQPSDAQRPDLAEWKKESATRCQGLTPDDYASASEWLSLAASQGSLSAQLTYAGNVEAVIGDASDLLRDPDAVKAYKERSHEYLKSAMRYGSIDALISLGNSYGYGIMMERDFSLSYAYFLAAAKADPKLNNSPEIRYLKEQLSSTQISEATRKGNAIYDECCNRPAH